MNQNSELYTCRGGGRDNRISFIRIFATLLIIICHIMQYYDYYLAWWFNVGVQIFLFLSGYLYGNKDKIEGITCWYFNRLKRILIDYYLFIFPGILFAILFNKNITLTQIISLISFSGSGGYLAFDHLWFISTILFCYFLTPFFLYFLSEQKVLLLFIRLIIGLLIIEFICTFYFKHFTGAWINCYFMGIVYRKIKNQGSKNQLYLFDSLSVFLCCCCNILQIFFEMKNYNQLIPNTLWIRFCAYSHVLLGFSLFLIIYRICGVISEKLFSILKFSDKISYDIYLVHQFFILGDFSILNIEKGSLPFKYLLLLLTILTCSIIVNYFSSLLSRLLTKRTQL